MDTRRAVIMLLAVVAAASFAMPAGAFIGAGITMDKHIGDTVNFNLNPTLVQAAGVAQGLAAMDLGVTWGVDYDLSTLAGYPYGYGGVGALTDANIGYTLGVSVDEAHGTAFDGAAFGIPLAQQDLSRTSFNNVISANNHISDAQVALPWAFPVL
jgi:hypothetical protein